MNLEEWTEEQKVAIGDSGHNLLVSAAAGSGKTAVLVERIKRLVIEEHVNIDEMLIVTFTDAAASEMKAKIYKALQEAGIKDQIDRMGRSSIGSFDSFAYSVVRRYYQLINVDPNLSICDGPNEAILKEEALDDLYEEMFETKDKDFLHFLDCYETKPGSTAVRDMIIELRKFIMAMPDPWGWLESAVEPSEHMIDRYLDLAQSEVLSLLEYSMSYYQYFADTLALNGFEKAAKAAMADVDYACDLISLVQKDAESGFEFLVTDKHKAVSMPRKGTDPKFDAEKDLYIPIRDSGLECRKKAKEIASGLTREILAKEIRAMSPKLKILAKLTRRFDEIYQEKKLKEKCMDFSDVEHFALEILGNKLAADEYREKFKYIFVDEYQDTNSLQEALIKRIVRENNLFMVGDVKQCIYKFRLSEPELFLNHYKEYKAGTSQDNLLVDLNSNFRSKQSVIDAVNDIFSSIMTEENCGMVYDSAASLVKGSKYDGPLSYNLETYILNSEDNEDLDDAVANLQKNELAAAHAVSIIKKYYGSTIHDDKTGEDRPLGYKDMVVLLPALKNVGESYYKAFLDANIPVYIDRNEGYFDTIEVKVFLNLLRIIDNRKQDIPLLSVLTCPIFGFTSEDLAKVRMAFPKGPFYEAFFEYAKTDEKAGEFARMLDSYENESKILPLADFIFNLLLNTGYADFESAKNGGAQRLANLKALVSKAERFEQNNLSGLTGFVSFVEMLVKRGASSKTGQAKTINESMDCVRIMTIHKSKGLEFPFVLVSGISEKLITTTKEPEPSMHKEYGLAIKLVDNDKELSVKTHIAKLIKREQMQDILAEKIRLLYVAMTRAKDILCFSAFGDASTEKTAQRYAVIPGDLNLAKTYLDLIYGCLDPESIHVSDKNSLAGFITTNAKAEESFEQTLANGFNKVLDENVDKLMSYKYFDEPSIVKRKYSVSQIAEEARTGLEHHELSYEEDEPVSVKAVPRFIEGSVHNMTGAERGTAYHAVMEHIPFKPESADINYIRSFVTDLVQKNILSEEQANCINPEKIKAFFDTEIGKRAIASSKIHKEAPFVMKHAYNGQEVLVQGTIDCYFEEDDGLVLVDYKSNYVDKNDKEGSYEHLKEIYMPQLDLYKEALEKITGKTVKLASLYLFGTGETLIIE